MSAMPRRASPCSTTGTLRSRRPGQPARSAAPAHQTGASRPIRIMRTRGDSFVRRHAFLAFLAPLVAGVALAQDIGQAPPSGGQTVTATDSKGNVINVTGTITPP